MNDIEKSTFDAYFDELLNTAEIRTAYTDIIVKQSSSLFAAFIEDSYLKSRLKQALALKTTDESAMLRGLFVQSIGIFDEFIRYLIASVVDKKARETAKYSDLPENFRNGFLSHAGSALAHYGKGSVNGVRYDFSKLTSSITSCLSDSDGYILEPRVFTILMGNFRSNRLIYLFEILDLPEPFSPEIGECQELKAALRETKKGQVATMAEKKLNELISLRNEIAHGDLTTSISIDEFRENIKFLRALTIALYNLCK